MRIRLKKIRGHTLVELLVALVVGSFIIIGAFSFFMVIGKFSTEQLAREQLNSELTHLATIISRELTRAGFCNDCSSSNPFILKDSAGASSAILLGNASNEGSATAAEGSCVRFAYNETKRTAPSSVDNKEKKGFRLRKTNDKYPTIEMYAVYKTLNNWGCSTGGYWQSMIDNKKITITDLKFTRTAQPAGTNKLQKIVVTIKAYWTNEPSIVDSIEFTVIPNNIDS
ncbi:MAG: prepilin-type N-terminal cleavage/methylation domain-containing protein [Enterovibrio sp.]